MVGYGINFDYEVRLTDSARKALNKLSEKLKTRILEKTFTVN